MARYFTRLRLVKYLAISHADLCNKSYILCVSDFCLYDWTNNDLSFFFDLQKLNSRKAALMKTKGVKEEEKPSLRASLLPCLMSSEVSDDEGTFTVRPLPWRSARATDIHHSLDDKCDRRRSIRSKMMRFARKEGVPSDRRKPQLDQSQSGA